MDPHTGAASVRQTLFTVAYDSGPTPQTRNQSQQQTSQTVGASLFSDAVRSDTAAVISTERAGGAPHSLA